jgi:hypothetical protein
LHHVRQLVLVAFALFVIACGGGSGSDSGVHDGGVSHAVVLRWRSDAAIAGYVIHWGHVSGDYTNALDVGSPPVDGDGVTSFLLEVGASGTISFAITSYDDEFAMSAFSNELSADVP